MFPGHPVTPDASALERQIQFARHNFDNHQALIRASDAKDGVMVTLMVFLAASSLQVSKDAAAKLQWGSYRFSILSTLFLLAAAGLVVAVIRALVMRAQASGFV